MKDNVCVTCEHYESCGQPDRPMKCMGYDKAKEDGENGTDKK